MSGMTSVAHPKGKPGVSTAKATLRARPVEARDGDTKARVAAMKTRYPKIMARLAE